MALAFQNSPSLKLYRLTRTIMRMPNTGWKKTGLIFFVGVITLLLSLQFNNTYGQSCFPSCNNLRITFKGGGFTTSNNNIRICPGQSTVLKLDTSACSGSGLNFSGLTFQWQYSLNGGSFSTTIPGNPIANRDSIIANQEGYYRLLITGSSCSTTVSDLRYNSNTYNDAQIEFYDLPNVSVSPSAASICAGSTTGASLTASGADSYNWTPTIGLNTSSGANVIAKPLTTTSYIVTGKSSITTCTRESY